MYIFIFSLSKFIFVTNNSLYVYADVSGLEMKSFNTNFIRLPCVVGIHSHLNVNKKIGTKLQIVLRNTIKKSLVFLPSNAFKD
jgi:hypothetical protein